MKPQTKSSKQEIDLYFKGVEHSIHTYHIQKGRTLIYIEYRDFLSEKHVMESLRGILGGEVLLSIKRNCSDSLMDEIRKIYGEELSQLELCRLMSSYEP